jgi:hypothetical protein
VKNNAVDDKQTIPRKIKDSKQKEKENTKIQSERERAMFFYDSS